MKMAYEMYDLKGIIFLVLFGIPMIASMNINCRGKAFHCVNSTHFMICVDLGDGVSTTIDDFVIPCPITTECQENNTFECDFPNIEFAVPPLQVIGVYKQSDTGETIVTNSVTAPTPTSDILSVFKENVTATTLPIPEEVTPVLKLEILENIKNPTGAENSENSTETTFQVTSSFTENSIEIVNDELSNNNTIIIFANDNSKNFKHVEASTDKAVIDTLLDKSKSIDTVTSVIGLINLISTDAQSVSSTISSSDVSASLDTLYDDIATTTKQYITEQVTKHDKKIENITGKLNIPTENTFGESVITEEFSMTPVVNTYFENDLNNTIGFNNKKLEQRNSSGENNSTIAELVPETNTELPLAPTKIVNILEPVTVDVNFQTKTDKTFPKQSVLSTNSVSDHLNTLYDNTATTTNQYTTKQETKNGYKNKTLMDEVIPKETILSDKLIITETSTTPIINTNIQSFRKYEVNNVSFTELKSTSENTTTENISETNSKYFIREPMTAAIIQTTTETNFVPIIADENITFATETATYEKVFNNNSLVEEQTIVNQPLEIIITTDSPIELTDNLYQINRELKLSFISIKNNTSDTSDTTNTTKVNIVYDSSITDTFNDKGTESTSLLPSTIKYPANEILTTKTLQNEFTAHVTEVINELPSTSVPFIVNKPYMENVTNDKLLITYTTPASYNVNSVPNTTLKDLTSQTDIVTNAPIEIITPNSSDGFTFMDHRTSQKVITNQENKILDTLNQLNNLETVTVQENLNTDQWNLTIQDEVVKTTTYWNIIEYSATTPLPRDFTENTNLNDSINPINQDTNSSSNILITLDLLPKTTLSQTPPLNHYVTELTSKTPESVHTTSISMDYMDMFEQVSSNTPEIDNYRVLTDYKIETSTTFPVDVSNKNKIEDSSFISKLAITTIPPQELTNQKVDTVKQLNTTSITTETVNDLVNSTVTTAGNTLPRNTNDINLNTSISENFNNETIISKVDPNEDVNMIETETVNLITGKHCNNTTLLSPTAKTYKDESIKTVSVLDIVNSSINLMENVARQPSSSNLSSSDDYIKITKSQDSRVNVSTTDYIPGYNFVQVTTDFPNNPEIIVSLSEKKVTDLVLSTTSIHTLPIIEANTENLKDVISTEASLPNTIDFEYSPKIEIKNVTEKTNYYIFSQEVTLTGLNKLPKVEVEPLVITVSDFTPGTTVLPNGRTTVADYDEGTKIKPSAFVMSSTEIMPQIVKDNMQIGKESPVLTTKLMETQTIKYDSTALSLPILTAAQITTGPTIFAETMFAAIGKTNNDVVPGKKSTDLPHYVMPTVNNNPQSTTDITTETIINTLTQPDLMVETIEVDGGKVSEAYHGSLIPRDIISNNGTVNDSNVSVKSVKKIIDHENIVFGNTLKNNTQNITLVDVNRAEIVNHTENNWMLSDVNIDSVKIKDSSIEGELTSKSSVLKSDMDLQNKTILSDYPVIAQIDPKYVTTVDIIEYRLLATTTNPSTHVTETESAAVDIIEYRLSATTTNPSTHVTETESAAPKNITQSKTIITKENKNADINSSVNGNIKLFDVGQYQVQADFVNITNSYNINNTNENITTYHTLSLHNNTFNDELEQHLISTNHTITAEVQRHLNESDKQNNKTRDELTMNRTSMHNPNLTSIKLNADSKDKSATSASASLFNCSNQTRGKYADNKDCRKFYTCIGNLQPIIGTCPNNTVFSEINKQCTRNLSHCVRNNQFRCLFEGRFSDFFKDNIYYICVKNSMNGFLRYKLQCQADYHLNKVSVKCEKNEDESNVSTLSVSSVSETNTEESTPIITSEKIIITDDFECDSEGLFPFTKDCTKYYVCTKIKDVYRRKIKKCASEEVYDKIKKKCVESDSGEC